MAIASTTASPTAERLEGLDLLRGLCALGVATYHLLSWTKVSALHNLGLYGVYAFFTLSGTSLALAYTTRLREGHPLQHYLLARYLRLAPLYTAVATWGLLTQVARSGLSEVLLTRWLLNVTLLFGLANPGEVSLVTGGWSLGIEFCFYLVFPLLVALSGTRALGGLTLAALVVQVSFVNYVLNDGSLERSWVRYTQPLAFTGYFCAGVWLGCRLVDRPAAYWPGHRTSALLAVALTLLLATWHGPTAAGSLTGLRGVVCTLATLVLVVAVARLPLQGASRRVARLLGDCSYPLYLIHPLVFAVARSPHVLPELPATHPVAFVGIVLTLSLGISFGIHRALERPVLRWGKARLERAARGGHATAS